MTTTFIRALLGAALLGAALAGCAAPAPTDTPSADRSSAAEADVRFAQDMVVHHRQAVEMAELAASRTENPQVLDLAARIGAAQEPEIATMTGWLTEWGADVPAAMPMSGTDHGSMDHSGMSDMSGMSGMMTGEEMTRLEQASGPTFDRLFLELMIVHHEGALAMASAELTDPRAVELAGTIRATQQAEIDEMRGLLART